MPISGYDPEDLEETLAELLAERDPSEFLDEEGQRRLAGGESLLDLLDGEDIERLLHEESSDQPAH